MYKIIACDLDETLIGKGRAVSEENVEAIRRAKELGVRFVPATGRGFLTVEGTLKELGLYDQEDQYVISYNGGVITENKGNRKLSFNGMTYDMMHMLFERGKKYDVVIRLYTTEMVYAYNMTENERAFGGARATVKEFTGDMDFLKDKELVKVVYAKPDYDYLHEVAADMSDIADLLDISYSSGRYLELNPKGVNKGYGLRKLADMLGVAIEDTIAIGDNYNDLPMIKAAGLGVGVANTVEAMKAECDVITDADYLHNAVAEVIRKYILSE